MTKDNFFADEGQTSEVKVNKIPGADYRAVTKALTRTFVPGC